MEQESGGAFWRDLGLLRKDSAKETQDRRDKTPPGHSGRKAIGK